MRKYLWLGMGGFVGAIARFTFKSVPIGGGCGVFPLNTLLINLAGSFLLALLLTIFLEVRAVDEPVRLGVTVGLLGALTTFSTLCKETAGLLQRGDWFSALSYLAASVALGLGAVFLGIVLARRLGRLCKAKKDNRDL